MKRIALIAVLSVLAPLAWVPAISLAATFLTVDDAGNVGIGNTMPLAKLDVSGAMYSRLVTVSDTSSLTIDWSEGNVQSLVLTTATTTLAFTNGRAGGEYKLIVKQDATGGRALVWPGTATWIGGGLPPRLATTASSTDIVSFVYDGTEYFGSVALHFAAPVDLLTTSTTADGVVSFAYNSSQVDAAQSFTTTAAGTISALSALINTQGSPTGDVVVGIQSDAGGHPSGTYLASDSMPISSLPSYSGGCTGSAHTYVFVTPVPVEDNTTYWVVFHSTATNGTPNNLVACGDATHNPYGGGNEAYSDNGGSWTNESGADLSVHVSIQP